MILHEGVQYDFNTRLGIEVKCSCKKRAVIPKPYILDMVTSPAKAII